MRDGKKKKGHGGVVVIESCHVRMWSGQVLISYARKKIYEEITKCKQMQRASEA